MERNVLVENMAVLMHRHLVDEYDCTEHRAETIADWVRGFKNEGNAELAEPKERIIAAAIQVEGFLTSTGRFVNSGRRMAGQPQLRPEGERHQRDLFSEDLW